MYKFGLEYNKYIHLMEKIYLKCIFLKICKYLSFDYNFFLTTYFLVTTQIKLLNEKAVHNIFIEWNKCLKCKMSVDIQFN